MANFTVAEAAREISSLINSRLQSPRLDELEVIISKVSPLSAVSVATPVGIVEKPAHRDAWEAALAASDAANARVAALDGNDPRVVAAESEASAAARKLDECARNIFAAPVGTPADLALVANACFRVLWSEGRLTDADADTRMRDGPDCDVQTTAICVEALAALLRGVRDLGPHHPSTSATSREHIEYRAVAAAANAWSDETHEQAEIDRLMDQESAFANRIWDRPVENWFDVFLLAEVALHNENGILESLEGEEAYYDELAFAKLIKAAITVGRRHYG